MKATLLTASLLLFGSFLAGCAKEELVHGTTSYTSSPASSTSTGATPVAALLCEHPDLHGVYYVELGPACALRVVGARSDAWTGVSDGTSARVTPMGPCALPAASGAMDVDVSTATGALDANALTLTLGGQSRADGRYVTYRFTGPRGTRAPAGACAVLTQRFDDDVKRVARGD